MCHSRADTAMIMKSCPIQIKAKVAFLLLLGIDQLEFSVLRSRELKGKNLDFIEARICLQFVRFTVNIFPVKFL